MRQVVILQMVLGMVAMAPAWAAIDSGATGAMAAEAATVAAPAASPVAAAEAQPAANEVVEKELTAEEKAQDEANKKAQECEDALAASDGKETPNVKAKCKKPDVTTATPKGSDGTETKAAEGNIPANGLGADRRDQAHYNREGYAGRQRGTKEMKYVTFEEAEKKNLPWGWTEGTRTSDFGPRESKRTQNGNKMSSNHMGEDYSIGAGLTQGTDIYSNQNGKVVYAGDKGGYGKTVIVQDANGNQTQYSHLSAINVAKGDQVIAGYKVGDAGATGNSTAAHLHYGEKVAGNYVNPATSKGVKNYDVNSLNSWSKTSTPSTAGAGVGSTGTGAYVGAGNSVRNAVNQIAGGLFNTSSGLGQTVEQMLGGLLGGNSSQGSGNMMSQLMESLLGGGSSGNNSAKGNSSTGTSVVAADGTVKNLVRYDKVTEAGKVTETKTYSDGTVETVVTNNATTTTDGTLSAGAANLLAMMQNGARGYDVAQAVKSLCADDLSTSADAQMLKVGMCQSSNS